VHSAPSAVNDDPPTRLGPRGGFPFERQNWPAILVEQRPVSIAYTEEKRSLAAATRQLLLLLSLSLGGCVTTNPGSSVMDARAEAPAPATAHAYLPVEDLPPNRETPGMTTDDQAKLKKDLINARARQAAIAKAKNGSPQPATAKPQ
jgi:hypothetical protein